MFAVLRKSSPAVRDYAKLFDYDEARLAAGSGSEMLDAYLRLPVAQRDAEAVAVSILNSEPDVMADAFARLCALTLARDDKAPAASQRLPVSQPSLRALRDHLWKNCEWRWLDGAETAKIMEIIRRDPEIAANGWIDFGRPQLGRTVADEVPTLLLLALQGGEGELDPAFEALLKASFERLRAQAHAYDPAQLKTASDFAKRCIDSLCKRANRRGFPGFTLSEAPGWLRALAEETVEPLLAQWRETLPPLLWRYIAFHIGRPVFAQDTSEGLIAEMLAATPQARGDLVVRIWDLERDAECKPPGLPWTLSDVLYHNHSEFRPNLYSPAVSKLWRALCARPCKFSPEFALKLLTEDRLGKWIASAGFARSIAAALPRTPEVRQIVERLRGDLSESKLPLLHGHWNDSQMLVLREALAADDAPQTLEARAEAARAAFECAMQEARARQANSGLSICSMPTPTRLCQLAVAAARLGPVPASFAAAIQEIEDAIDPLKPLAGLPPARALASLEYEYQTLGYLSVLAARVALEAFAPLTAAQREAWLAAEDLALRAPANPSASPKWSAAARKLSESAEGAVICDVMNDLLGCAATLFLPAPVESVLGLSFSARRALIWQLAFHPAAKAANLLCQIAAFATQPVEGRQIDESIGNAALWALGNLRDDGGLPMLARLAQRARYPKVRKRIDAMIETAARKTQRSRAEIEEDIAPRHDFSAAGALRLCVAGEATVAEIRMSARGKAEFTWRNAASKVSNAPPAAMKEANPAAIKAIKQAARDIELDFGVHAKRVEKLYRSTRALDFARWRESYVEHPFVGLVARRLIWRAGDVAGLWRDGGFEDGAGARHDVSDARLTLWHPAQAREPEILAWRDRLATLGIDQPFRQAWRESYRVTDAERVTGHYSNRFAGHFVRQHQLIALARLNDWSCRHRLWRDADPEKPTFVVFPEHGVYAEYWTSGVAGGDPPTSGSDAYVHLTTDRVVFHRLNPQAQPNRPLTLRGERLHVDEVPPVVFSEILRSCDLFVSVASIARDAQWLDRGRDAQHPNGWRDQADAYWRRSCAEPLQASAQVRRDLLARLLPALGAGDRLSLDDRRLHVRGVRGAYAIHLGSGAAFHESGQHICIVPDGAPKKLVLPYEGDETLALIVSKAMLLLRDDKIVDPVILRQL